MAESQPEYAVGGRYRGRVLVAEDNAVNRQLAVGMLVRFGLASDVAEDGEQALARLEEGTYDLVLMDVQMRALDGYQATRRLPGGTGKGARPYAGGCLDRQRHGRRPGRGAGGGDGWVSGQTGPTGRIGETVDPVASVRERAIGHRNLRWPLAGVNLVTKSTQ